MKYQVILTVVGLLHSLSLFAQLPAFPGAEGFGAYATGGRGGDVYTVVNLNSSGPGSLRYGVETAPAQGRTIVFAVSGYIPINYNSDTGNQTVRLVQNNIGIYGQTAPGDGIGLKDGRILITGDNSVLRHIRVRHGKYGGAGDCVNIESSARDTMLDHVTLMFSTDENVSFFNSNADDFTLQYCTSAWGMERHNAGGLWDLQDGTCHHSLWAHHRTRNPKARPYGLLEWINNVTYHWRSEGFIMGDSQSTVDWYANVIGCYYISLADYEFGLDTTPLSKARIDNNGNPNFHIYLTDTLIDADGDGTLNGVDNGYGIVSGVPYPTGGTTPGTVSYDQSATPFAGSPVSVTIDDPLTAYKKVLSSAGALRLDASYGGPLRDELDTLLIDSVVNQESILVAKDTPRPEYPADPPSNGEAQLAAAPYNISNNGFGTLTGTVAPTDTDGDGMPDFWEQTLGSNVNGDDHNSQVPPGAYIPNSPAGYTLLEEYLYFRSIPHAVIDKNTTESPSSFSTDLGRYTRGFDTAPVVFMIGNQVNCTAVMQPDGFTVLVTPTLDFFGRARFDFTVTDGDGSTWTQTFALLASGVFVPTDLTWVGDGSANVWDTNTVNFVNGPSASAFSAGDNVLFDDTGFNSPAINVTGTITPGVVQVDASQNYTFGGSGTLAGAMSLVKSGTGTLTIDNSGPNTFGGGSTISDGTVTLSTTDALGIGPVTLENDATLNLGTYSLAAGNSLTISDSPTITGGNGGGLTDIRDVSGSGVLNITVTSGVLDLQGNLGGFNGELQFSGGNSVRLYGSTGSSVTEFDLGTGTLNLNKRSSVGTVTLGALSGGPNTTLQGSSGGGNTTATTYSIGAKNQNTTFAGTIIDGQGTTGITKTGSGTQTLSGNNSYTGATTVDDGTLLINGNNGPSAVTVNSGGILGGTGTIGGLVTVNSGGQFGPGNSAGTSTVTGGLTLNSPTMVFDLSSSPGGSNDKITMVGGLLDMNGTQNYQFNLTDGLLTAGTYVLIDGGDNTDAAGVGFTDNLPDGGRQTFSMQRPASGNGQCYVRLVVTGNAASLLWRGNVNSSWDQSTFNWLNGVTSDRYYNFDAVTLDDSAVTGNVNVVGTLGPLSMLVSNSSLAYTITGGTLNGPMSLTKKGSGTLTVNNTFAHTGGTTIEEGTVALGSNTALGLNPVTLAGGTLAPTSGDFQIPLVIDGSGTFQAAADTHTYLKAPISGTGTLTVVPSGKLWTYEHDLSGFVGAIVLSGGGSLRFNQGGYTWGSPDCEFDLGASGILNNRYTTVGGSVYLGALSGGAGSTLMASEKSDGPGQVDTYHIGQLGLDTTFNGTIIDGPAHLFAFTKVGVGTQTLTGASTYSGGTLVSAGTMLVNNTSGSGTGSGAVTVQAGALLGGNGSLAGNATLDDGAILAPGASSGTLTFDGDLTLSDLTVLRYEMGTTSDQVVANGDLIAAGLLEVTNTAGFGPGIYTLFSWNTNQTLVMGELVLIGAPAGYGYSLSTNTPGQIDLVVSSPAPSIDAAAVVNGDFVMSGSGGSSGADYYVLTSTNVFLPGSNWVRLFTNQFDGSGNFSFTNTVNVDTPQEYFRLQIP